MICRQKDCTERLVTATWDGDLDFVPDSEPYEAGVEEEVDVPVYGTLSISVLWCPIHGVQKVWDGAVEFLDLRGTRVGSGDGLQVLPDPEVEYAYDLEWVYDEQIAPLMLQISAICRAHDLPMLASFCYQRRLAEGESYCNSLQWSANRKPVMFRYLEAMLRSEGIVIGRRGADNE
jgi:hypothetical protein